MRGRRHTRAANLGSHRSGRRERISEEVRARAGGRRRVWVVRGSAAPRTRSPRPPAAPRRTRGVARAPACRARERNQRIRPGRPGGSGRASTRGSCRPRPRHRSGWVPARAGPARGAPSRDGGGGELPARRAGARCGGRGRAGRAFRLRPGVRARGGSARRSRRTRRAPDRPPSRRRTGCDTAIDMVLLVVRSPAGHRMRPVPYRRRLLGQTLGAQRRTPARVTAHAAAHCLSPSGTPPGKAFAIAASICPCRFSGLGWVLMNSGGRCPELAWSRIRITSSSARGS